MTDLIGPSEILEELADKVIVQMERLAVTGFRAALREMTDFHRFLIESYAVHEAHSPIDNYAELGDWRSLHQELVGEYNRLFERGVEYIGRENDFIDALAHVPVRLLPQDASKWPASVAIEALNLANYFVHRLEAWVTKHSIPTAPPQGTVDRTIASLAGSNKAAYRDAISAFVGSWEECLRRCSHIYRWSDRVDSADDEWRRYSLSWPFMWQHIRNTAYLLAVAVWNDDRIGAEHYRDVLLRWPNTALPASRVSYHFKNTYLYPDIVDLDWPSAQQRGNQFSRFRGLDPVRPADLFASLVEAMADDVRLVVIGIILGWHVERKVATDLAIDSTRAILRGHVDDDPTGHHTREINFPRLISNLVRVIVAGERFSETDYSGRLDKLVDRLDAMAERPVIPGRIFSPSTRHETTDLFGPWLVCALSLFPEDDTASAIKQTLELMATEDALPQGDRSLRNLLHDLRQMSQMLKAEDIDFLTRGLMALRPGVDARQLSNRLAALIDQLEIGIENQRLQRLKDRSVDAVKLETIRHKVQHSLIEDRTGIELFSDFRVATDGDNGTEQEKRITNVDKGALTSPPMANDIANYEEHIVQRVQHYAEQCVWYKFANLPRRKIDAPDASSYWQHMKEFAGALRQQSRQAVLLVNGYDDPPWIADWMGAGAIVNRPSDMQVVRKREATPSGYLCTINGIDVYRLEGNPQESVLFPAELLEAISYKADSKGNVVDVQFVVNDDDARKGTLVFRFFQATKWRDGEVVTLNYPPVAASEHEGW